MFVLKPNLYYLFLIHCDQMNVEEHVVFDFHIIFIKNTILNIVILNIAENCSLDVKHQLINQSI